MSVLAPDPIDMPTIERTDLPAVGALSARVSALVTEYNEVADAAARLPISEAWSAAVGTAGRLRAQITTLVEAAALVAANEDAAARQVRWTVDHAIGAAENYAHPNNVARDAEPGHLRCLGEARRATVTSLQALRAQLVELGAMPS